MFSMNDQRLKERLLREPNLTLEKTIDTCRAAEIASAQIQAMSAATQERFVHAVHKKKQDSQPRNKGPKQPFQHTQSSGHVNMCRKCGKSHQPKQCPAYGFSCHKCGKQNHYAKMCGSGKAQHRKTVHDISPEIDTLFIGTVNIGQLDSSFNKSWYSEVRVDNMSIGFKLDTGAEANVLPLRMFKSIERMARRERRAHLQLQPTKTVLVAYGGMRLRPEGLLTLKRSTPKAHASLPFYISRHHPHLS